jgi:hypothetical protein
VSCACACERLLLPHALQFARNTRPALALCNDCCCSFGCRRELGNGHARAVADSISHEVGHTFGLAHFGGVGSAPYNEGEGPWGPLLGQPYARTLSQWSHGLAVSGSVQDDVAAISQSGLPCVADDHGDTPATATPLCEQPQQLGARCSWQADSTAVASAWSSGTIGHGDDVDVFSVQAPQAGEVDVRLVLPSSRSGLGINNLLASVSVSDGQRVLATAQPVTGAETVLEARFRLDAAAGELWWMPCVWVGVRLHLATDPWHCGCPHCGRPACDRRAHVSSAPHQQLRQPRRLRAARGLSCDSRQQPPAGSAGASTGVS